MNFNDLLFLAPEFSPEATSLKNVIWVPRNFEQVGKINALITDMNLRASSVKSPEISRPKFAPPAGGKMSKISIASSKNTHFRKSHPHFLDDDAIPCLYLPYYEGSDKFLLYFHGNSEDIFRAEEFVACLCAHLRVPILSSKQADYNFF